MSEQYATANGLRLAYEEFGNPQDPAIFMIMGLGMQLIAWPEELCRQLAAGGYRVIRFDNRDVGLSDKLDHAGLPSIMKVAALSRLNLPTKVPYLLRDMAQDVLGLMNALDIPAAHLVGASMGGMIAQLLAGEHPGRVLSLTSIMSTSGNRSLPGARRKVAMHMMRRPTNGDRAALEAHGMRTWRLIGSPAYPPSADALREKVTAGFERCFYPDGQRRQMSAILASGDRTALLKRIVAPTLVIHGLMDPLVPAACGVDTARHVPNARLELIDGMGHDLPVPLIPTFANLIGEHVDGGLKVAVAG